MITKICKKELERLGRSDDEIKLVLECRKALPILFNDNNDIEKYCINAIDLWNQIGSKNDFAHWSKSNIINSDNVDSDSYQVCYCRVKSWSKDPKTGHIAIDYISSSEAMGLNPSQLSANGITTSYLLTIDCAQDIAMYIGALPRTNKETKELSKKYRKYFRIMEDVVIQNKEWWAVRDPEKIEYKKMSEEVNNQCLRIWGRKAYKSDYAVEADMLNEIVCGKSSKQLKLELRISSFDLLRDYLKKDHNEELLFLEIQNQILLQMDMMYNARKELLTNMHNVKFKKDNMKVA